MASLLVRVTITGNYGHGQGYRYVYYTVTISSSADSNLKYQFPQNYDRLYIMVYLIFFILKSKKQYGPK